MSPDVIESNLRAHWRASAYTGRRARGAVWYPTARQWCANLADGNGVTLAQVVAVLAITSPGFQLATNMEHTRAIVAGERDTGGRFPNANLAKIRAVLADASAAESWARGPKVSPFHRAILGDVDALVLDRWAIFAAIGARDDRSLNHWGSTGARNLIDDAYRTVAREVRQTVSALQATVWLQVRETTTRAGDAAPRRLWDLTTTEGV